MTPASTLTWAVGDQISYSATATDPQQGPMPSSAFSWQLEIRHCPSGVCHTHPFGTFTGATGSFTAPPHEYPSHLLLTVTVTDSGGLTDSRTIQLNPKTVDLTFASSPSGAGVTIGEVDTVTPDTETFIQGAPVTVTAAATTGTGASVAAFSAWSDGGARSHTITPPATPTTYTATYTRPTAGLVANPTSGPAPLTVAYTASATNAPGVTGGFTYAWDLDNDGQYDDGTGPTQGATYATAGARTVGVRATDSRGATDAKSVTVTVGPPNQNPVPAISANPTSGPAPLAVSLSAEGSADPDGTALTYAWDLDDDGQFDDATGVTTSKSFTGVGAHQVTVQVKDADNGIATTSITVTVTNTGPVAHITTNPPSGSGPAPLTVAFDASGSTDPDGGTLTYAWDLDGDGAYDDGTGAAAAATFPVGASRVALKVTDTHGTSGTAITTVTATNTAPTVTRLTAYPAGGFFVGQSLGFDAAATDPQQALPDSAYSFAMERQACDSGCPRVLVQTWTGVGRHQFLVPQLPYPSHLYLIATATDAHGATGRSELRIDPRPATLTVRTNAKKLKVSVAGEDRKDRWSGQYVVGTTVRLVAKKHQVRKGVRYAFVRWSDGGARKHDVQLWAPALTVKAVYRRLR